MQGTEERDGRGSGAIGVARHALRTARDDIGITAGVLSTPGQLRRMLFAEGQSALGDSAAYVALLLIAYQRLHSPWALSAVLLVDRVPRIVLAPFAGVLADRVSRRACLVAADVLRGCALAGIVLTGSFGVTVLLVGVMGCGTSLYRPVAEASLPVLSESPRDAARAVTSRWTIISSGELIGPALAGLVFLLSTPSMVLLLDAWTFAISALVLSRSVLDRAVQKRGEPEAGNRTIQMLVEGMRATREIPGVLVLIVTALSAVIAGGMMAVGDPLLAKTVLHSGNSGFAALIVCFGGGLVLGSGFSGPRGSISSMRSSYSKALAVAAVGIVLMASAPTFVVALLGVIIVGAGNGLAVARSLQLIQLTVPEALIGRVNGLLHAAEAAAFVLAFSSGGAAVSLLGVRATFAISALGIGLAALIGFLRMRRVHQVPSPPDTATTQPRISITMCRTM